MVKDSFDRATVIPITMEVNPTTILRQHLNHYMFKVVKCMHKVELLLDGVISMNF